MILLKDESYDLILAIINLLMTIVYYKSIKVIIDISSLFKIIWDVMI